MAPVVRVELVAAGPDGSGDLAGYVDHLEDGRYLAVCFLASGVELAEFGHAVQTAAQRLDAGDVRGWEPVDAGRLRLSLRHTLADFTVPDTVPADWSESSTT